MPANPRPVAFPIFTGVYLHFLSIKSSFLTFLSTKFGSKSILYALNPAFNPKLFP
jgi:hypothetical protein